ncbi:four helix bundle protein [Maribacter chungangensis]|uniref:Four helix bundle protein n=1 Tax=Maribacter chungangensis TaxID=1069117 RepID=A0ABW3B256_9FLAO
MAKIEKFEDMEIWQLARKICVNVYHIIETTELNGNYALRNQMDRSSGSIMDNIAEGFERSGNKEFRQFLSISKGSCGELRSQFYRALDRGYIDKSTFNAQIKILQLESKKISSFMHYLKKSEYKGSKFD